LLIPMPILSFIRMAFRLSVPAALLACIGFLPCAAQSYADAARGFVTPPEEARPWVYWFWVNNNVTKEGITADLEAMKRVGIGGVLIMAVDQGAPNGTVTFGSQQWRDLFTFACEEAARLGLAINMNNDAGWCGSGGPWITPALSMQQLVYTETTVQGPQQIEEALPQPKTNCNYYEDILVQAYPTPTDGAKITDLNGKSALERQDLPAQPATYPDAPAGAVIDPSKIVDLTASFRDGRLTWDVPPGKWTIVRYGHTSTGVENHPAPEGGLGLESDKLSADATAAMYDGLMAKLVGDNRTSIGHSLVSTHIDSWETGSQNWTPGFREKFQQLRGYDPEPYWPVMTGRVVRSLEVSERFLWDIRKTTSDLLLQNYAATMGGLAQKDGLRLSIEGYDAPCDEMGYAGQCDEPMGEFWSWPWGLCAEQCTEMVSSGHVYGKRIIGAESFTADSDEKWLGFPARVKPLADWAFCEGINRFVVHRFAMQPWLDRKPGMSMGPWGLHYERTETWWDLTKPWHDYLARCQFLLRQGLFVADICYLEPEGVIRFHAPVKTPGNPPTRPGYNFDGCNADVVLNRMSVKNGRIVLPNGMSYRLLVLPASQTMTPALVAKIGELVKAGATVIGPRPLKSPSLAGYPGSDAAVAATAAAVWGDCDGQKVTAHDYGSGKIIWGLAPENVLASLGVPEDFQADKGRNHLGYIHRALDDGTDVYFIASSLDRPLQTNCTFRVTGKQPYLWWPQTGQTESVAAFEDKNGVTDIPLRLERTGSVFVVFRPGGEIADPVASIFRDGQPTPPKPPILVVQKASYGVPGDTARTRDVTAKVQALVNGGTREFTVADLAQGDDPAFGTVKTFVASYTLAGQALTARGQDTDTVRLDNTEIETAPELKVASDGQWRLETSTNGHYVLKTVSGKTIPCDATGIPDARPLKGPWELAFPPKTGAPDKVTLDQLASWSDNPDPGVKYFSGSATYRNTFTIDSAINPEKMRVDLDLGDVQVMAQLKINGRDLGILWKPPYQTDITQQLKSGVNTIEVTVTNLWINRMIGDEKLPEDSSRNPDGTLKAWPQWLQDGQPSPTGRFTFPTWKLWSASSPPQPSGLIGPVLLRYTARVPVQNR
jgi:hypothetical protein